MKLGKVLIVDGSNFLHRQLNQPALADMEYNGVKTGAVMGFLRSLLVSMNAYPGYYPIVVFDKGRSPRRLEIYPNYKRAQETKEERDQVKEDLKFGRISKEQAHDEFLHQLITQGDAIKDLLRVAKIPMIDEFGWEGDDIIAILSRVSEDAVIATDDKDMWQLCSENSRIVRPMRIDPATNQVQVVTHEDMIEWYDDIDTYIKMKGIAGDGSDNIPRVATGVGPVMAKKIISHLNELESMPNIEHSDYIANVAIPGVKGGSKRDPHPVEVFFENFDQYELNMQLVDLRLIDQDPDILSITSTQLEISKDRSNAMEFLLALGQYGITKFDYSRMISLLNSNKHNLEVI